jgi:hypothetical protein
MICYKKFCITHTGNRRVLCSVNRSVKFDVIYRRNIKRLPIKNTGGLFAFKTLKSAQAFSCGSELWKCECGKFRRIQKIANGNATDILRFWNKHNSISNPMRAPRGTILVDYIIPLEKIGITYITKGLHC